MNQSKKQRRDATAKACEDAANKGHYLERLENIAIALDDRDSEMAILSLRQLYAYAKCKPTGADGIMYDISMRLLIRAERDFKFTKTQLSRMWYGVHYDTHKVMGLKFPYEGTHTNEMRSDK